MVGSDRISVERTSADIAHFIERTGLAKLVGDDHELLAYGAGPIGDSEFDLAPGDAIDEPEVGENFADAEWLPESWKS